MIYAHSDGGFSVWDPARNYWRTRGGVDVQDRLPAYVFSATDIWDGLQVDLDGKPTVVCNGLVRDWAGWIKEAGDDAHNMAWVLKQLSPNSEAMPFNPSDPDDHFLRPGPLVRLSVNYARDIPSLRTPYAEAVPILHASAGVKRVVALAYMILWSWQEHRRAAELLGETPTTRIVLLIDEIESHLHPAWQRSILRSVLAAMQFLHSMRKVSDAAVAEVQLLAVTHSPLILASAEPLFDSQKDAWFDLDLVLDSHGRHVELSRRPWVRRGDASRWLMSEAFDLHSARSREAETLLDEAATALSDESFDRERARELDAQLRGVLGDDDPFWMNWRFVGEKRGWLP